MALSESRAAVRLNIRLENLHDLDGIVGTFAETGRFDDEPWDLHFIGHERVRAFYAETLRGLPDVRIEVRERHVSDTAVIIVGAFGGTHLGLWRGLPPTGRRVAIEGCGIFTFDDQDRLAGEKLIYDRASVLRQLGVFHEPLRPLGQVMTALTHPLTMLQIGVHALFGARRQA